MMFWGSSAHAARAVDADLDASLVSVVASAIFSVAVLLYVSHGVYVGSINLLHIHHEVFHTHQMSTVFSVLALVSTFALSAFPEVLSLATGVLKSVLATPVRALAYAFDFSGLSVALAGASSTLPRLYAVAGVAFPVVTVHVVGLILAGALSVLYKVAVICWKIYAFRTRTSQRRIRGSIGDQRPQRILIVYASVGSGHKRAAEAIRDELVALSTADGYSPVVQLLDIVKTQEWLLRTIYKQAFMNLVVSKAGSALIGYLYGVSDRAGAPDMQDSGFVAKIQKWLEEAFMLSFIEFIFEFEPDVIVNTHFLGLKVISHMRRKLPKTFQVPQVCAVTDFDVHSFWACQPCERFFVARNSGKLTLAHHGVDPDTVTVAGIPIVPAFAAVEGKTECLKMLGLEGPAQGKRVVLLMSGGGDVFEVYAQLLKCETPLQIVVVCGRQADVRSRLAKVPVPAKHASKLEGFTRVMHQYLSAADVIITKPGGLTTSEALATGTVMAVVNPLPGQELRNADMILEGGAGIKINDTFLISHKLDRIFSDEGGKRFSRMQSNAKALGMRRRSFSRGGEIERKFARLELSLTKHIDFST